VNHFKNRDAWADWYQQRDQVNAGPAQKPPEKYQTRTRSELEHEIQKTFIDWVRVVALTNPALRLMHAIPNGGQRHPAVAGKLKSEGVLAGIPDLHLPVPVAPWPSLYIEVKAPGEEPTKHQADRIEELRAVGNVVVVCHGVQQLIDITLAYLRGDIIDDQGRLRATG